VVTATFLAAIAQGFATSLALQFFGFGHFFLFFTVGTLTSMIPMLGTWIVWGPCAVWLAWQGHWVQAGVLATFGIVVIGMLDNVIRTYILHSDVRLHPLLAFVSVLGGLQALGLWGVFIGPIVASCLHALVQIFNTELHEFSREKFSHSGGDSDQGTSAVTPPNTDARTTNGTEITGSSAAFVATPATPTKSPIASVPKSKRRRSRKR
jgi:predicted PurR-regulated permease PerM